MYSYFRLKATQPDLCLSTLSRSPPPSSPSTLPADTLWSTSLIWTETLQQQENWGFKYSPGKPRTHHLRQVYKLTHTIKFLSFQKWDVESDWRTDRSTTLQRELPVVLFVKWRCYVMTYASLQGSIVRII